jgi:hypothetical protein
MSIAGQQFVRVPGLDNGHRRGDLSVELWDQLGIDRHGW